MSWWIAPNVIESIGGLKLLNWHAIIQYEIEISYEYSKIF